MVSICVCMFEVKLYTYCTYTIYIHYIFLTALRDEKSSIDIIKTSCNNIALPYFILWSLPENIKTWHYRVACVLLDVPRFDVLDQFLLLLPQNVEFLETVPQGLQSGGDPGLGSMEDRDAYPSRQIVQRPATGDIGRGSLGGPGYLQDCFRV